MSNRDENRIPFSVRFPEESTDPEEKYNALMNAIQWGVDFYSLHRPDWLEDQPDHIMAVVYTWIDGVLTENEQLREQVTASKRVIKDQSSLIQSQVDFISKLKGDVDESGDSEVTA